MAREAVASAPTEGVGDAVLIGGALGAVLGTVLGNAGMGILVGLVLGAVADSVREFKRTKGYVRF